MVVDGLEVAAAPAPGRGASQIVHASVADAGFFSMQREHVHVSVLFDAAAAVVKALGALLVEEVGAGAATDSSRGVSHTVHLSVTDAGFFNMQVEHSHASVDF